MGMGGNGNGNDSMGVGRKSFPHTSNRKHIVTRLPTNYILSRTVSKLSHITVQILEEKRSLRFLSRRLRGNVRYSLGVTAEALRTNVNWKSAFFEVSRSVWAKISGRRGRPPRTIFAR